MFPQPMSRPEPRPDHSSPDLTSNLEQHLRAGFPPDLALDLVLNELVVRAAEATRAGSAALALSRGDEMVCRAATGQLAPDLGVPLNTRDGLSGACVQTRQPQLSVDTEFDPRIDPVVSRRLGIRSILIVPVFDAANKSQFAGILEIFSSSAAAFSHNDQKVLEGFAEECASIRQAATEIGQRKPNALAPPQFFAAESIAAEVVPFEFAAHDSSASPDTVLLPARRPRYETWALVLGALTILATIAISFLIGSRVGWLSALGGVSSSQTSQPLPADSIPAAPRRNGTTKSAKTRSTPAVPAKTITVPSADELVVYEKGKVVFRMKAAPANPDSAKFHKANPDDTQPDSKAVVEASSTKRIAAAPSVWISPAQADARLLSRTEPQYPPEARAAHRAGNVVLEVQVAEDGSVSSVRTLSGDPLLATAAAEAVRTWRYQPYRQHDRSSHFQTDVTLSFTLPN
jgi:TonB family protein